MTFGEINSLVGWAVKGTLIGGAIAFLVVALVATLGAPDGGGLVLAMFVVLGGLGGAVAGLVWGMGVTVRRIRRGEAPPRMGWF